MRYVSILTPHLNAEANIPFIRIKVEGGVDGYTYHHPNCSADIYTYSRSTAYKLEIKSAHVNMNEPAYTRFV
jgi:hypothetical protein